MSRFTINQEDLVQFTLDLIHEKSYFGNEGGVAKLVEAKMRELGFEVECDELGNVIGSIGAGEGPCVLIDSHMDTVGVSDERAWKYNPRGEIVDSRIYGRGSMDMKGPLAASIFGIAALKDQLKRGKIVVSATIAEELVEGPATEHVARKIKPDYAIICEATELKIATGQRGRAEINIEIFGRPTHSSQPDFGINSADLMADVIRNLRSYKPSVHLVLGKGILVLTDIKSAPYPANSVVPDYCVVTYDRRTLPGETEEDVLAPIENIIKHTLEDTGATYNISIAVDEFDSYTGVTVKAPNFAPAWFFDNDSPIVQKAIAGLKETNILPEISHYAFCTNGSGTAGRLGIPTIGFGPGDEKLAHRTDEFIEIEALYKGAVGYAAIAKALVSEE
jgi:putative selenium metabolism hydrolase